MGVCLEFFFNLSVFNLDKPGAS